MKRTSKTPCQRRLRGALVLGLVALVAAACTDESLTGPESAQDGAPQSVVLGEGPDALRVMTWNIYVGTDVDVVLEADDPDQVPAIVAEAFQVLLSTRFRERAQAIARGIAHSRPHLIGLQEVSTIRLQPVSDFLTNPEPNAEIVLYNYLQILRRALAVRGLRYRVAGLIQNADVELPMLVSVDPLLVSDVRLTDFDVVLARHDVDILDTEAANYETMLEVAFPDFPTIRIPRGYVRVDARVGDRVYRLGNTHLEPVQPPGLPDEFFQLAQSAELVAALEADAPPGAPILIVGDLNTSAPTSITPVGPAYQFLTGDAGYVDVWNHNLLPGQGEGLTNPHDADLRNATVNFTQRIDLILVRNEDPATGTTAVGPVFATVLGDEQADRTLFSGLWPSDHAGVVAKLQLPAVASLVAANR